MNLVWENFSLWFVKCLRFCGLTCVQVYFGKILHILFYFCVQEDYFLVVDNFLINALLLRPLKAECCEIFGFAQEGYASVSALEVLGD